MLFSPLQIAAMTVLGGALVYIRWKRRQDEIKAGGGVRPGVPAAPAPRPPKPPKPPEEVYMDLRRKALEISPMHLGPAGDVKEDEAYGLLMEMGIANTVMTLACFANGDASVYYKNGGGMVGGSSHEPVRKAAKDFVALAQKVLPRMKKTTDSPAPGPDSVRFYALTPKGVFTTETARQSLGEAQNALSALYYGGQEVVSQMRQVQEERRAEAGR
ncbi:MAG TPA: hypothetical protein VHC97_20980 [Thermoanaerobaculia bacterium]|jgi:hypothetical protein|nr:hypothetical protein [Thermoanaerobaculia bacterium]